MEKLDNYLDYLWPPNVSSARRVRFGGKRESPDVILETKTYLHTQMKQCELRAAEQMKRRRPPSAR